jgi:hypothetical protein
VSKLRREKQDKRERLAKKGHAEIKVKGALAEVRKILPHPVVAILIASLIAFAGHSQLVIRGCGLLFVVLWLFMDLWDWLLGENTNLGRWRFIVGGIGTFAMLAVAVGIIGWMLKGEHEDQRADVFQHLEFSYINSSEASSDPMGTIFKVTNKSSYEISNKHELMCFTRSAVGTKQGLKMVLAGITTFLRDGKMMLAPVSYLPPPFSIGPHALANSTLKPGGDAQSDACLAWFKFSSEECADVTIGFWYALENQRDIEQEKSVRYFAYKDESGKFNWVQEPVNASTDYCSKFAPIPQVTQRQ